MAYVIKDRLNGQRLKVVYEASVLPIRHTERRRQVGRRVREYLVDQRARYALVAVGEESDTWWVAEEQGVSFAAAIEAWVMSVYRTTYPAEANDAPTLVLPDEFRVVIPLDERIYLATVRHGIVQNEQIIPPVQAEESLRTAQSAATVVYCFAEGDIPQAEWLHSYVQAEPLPFKLNEWRLRPAWLVLTVRGLFHPVQAIGLTVLSLVLSLTIFNPFNSTTVRNQLADSFFGDWVSTVIERWFPSEATMQPPTTILPKVAHSVSADLRSLAQHVVLTESLRNNGLQGLEWRPDVRRLWGNIDQGWPAQARQLATTLETAGSQWTLGTEGWTIHWSIARPESLDHPPIVTTETGVKTLMSLPGALRFRLTEGPTPVPGQFDPVANTQEQTLQRTRWNIRIDQAVVGVLLDQVNGFDSLIPLPAHLTQAECQFEASSHPTCSVTLVLLSL